jgi:hypothetical protein
LREVVERRASVPIGPREQNLRRRQSRKTVGKSLSKDGRSFADLSISRAKAWMVANPLATR